MKSKNKDFVYVGIQFLLFAIYFLAEPYFSAQFEKLRFGLWLSVFGAMIVLISIIQLNKSLSPFPSPIEGGSLITSGLYSIVRHPIYLGLLLFFLGYSIYSGSIFRIAITFLLAVLFHYKASYEETQLLDKYPDYINYSSKTSKIFPFT